MRHGPSPGFNLAWCLNQFMCVLVAACCDAHSESVFPDETEVGAQDGVDPSPFAADPCLHASLEYLQTQLLRAASDEEAAAGRRTHASSNTSATGDEQATLQSSNSASQQQQQQQQQAVLVLPVDEATTARCVLVFGGVG
jgi:hypothetical protein